MLSMMTISIPFLCFSLECEYTTFVLSKGINGAGAMLTQVHDGKLRPVQFTGRLFNKTQRSWHVSKEEPYVVTYAVGK